MMNVIQACTVHTTTTTTSVTSVVTLFPSAHSNQSYCAIAVNPFVLILSSIADFIFTCFSCVSQL